MKDFKFRVWDSVRMSYDPLNYPDYVLSTGGTSIVLLFHQEYLPF